jgi:hypothetical protein
VEVLLLVAQAGAPKYKHLNDEERT